MDEARREEIRRAVRGASAEGRIRCAAALELARRLDVDPREIGKACNAEKVKIVSCELGCFG